MSKSLKITRPDSFRAQLVELGGPERPDAVDGDPFVNVTFQMSLPDAGRIAKLLFKWVEMVVTKAEIVSTNHRRIVVVTDHPDKALALQFYVDESVERRVARSLVEATKTVISLLSEDPDSHVILIVRSCDITLANKGLGAMDLKRGYVVAWDDEDEPPGAVRTILRALGQGRTA